MAARWHHRRALEGILPEGIRNENRKVDFTPVIHHCLTPSVMTRWLTSNQKLHIAERGYVLQDKFLTTVATTESPDTYLITLLCLEGWLRYLGNGGLMNRLIPRKSSH